MISANYEMSLGLTTDATAAIGIVAREGPGKVRYLAVTDLWVQERQRLGTVTTRRSMVPTTPRTPSRRTRLERRCGITWAGWVSSSLATPQLINDDKSHEHLRKAMYEVKDLSFWG